MDTQGTQDETTFKPTTMAFATFWNFIDELASHPLPPQIDRSMMRSKSGTDQRNLITVLSSFELVGPPPQRRVAPALQALTITDKEERKAEVGKLVRRFYSEAVELSETGGTEQQLNDLFKDQFDLDTTDTRRKAVTFFLHAARTAGIPLSPYFPATRSGSGAPGAPRARRSGKRKPAADGGASGVNGDARSQDARPTQEAASYSTEVTIGDGTILILTAKNPNPFEFSKPDRDFFFGLVDRMKAYASAQTPPAGNGGAADNSATEERVS